MKDSFGARLKFFRSKAGLSQQQLANQAGLSRKIISDYEVKLDLIPRDANLYKIADVLGVDSSNLIPKTTFEDGVVQPNGEVEYNFNPNEFPKEFVKMVKQLAEARNTTFSDEFNRILGTALKSMMKNFVEGEVIDSTDFDNRQDQLNEKAFFEYLKSIDDKKAP